MPLAHNPLFIGREADLRALAQALNRGATAAIGQIAAATGLGGIGKTQLAAEFAHRYGQFFAGGVFWLSFADPAGVPSEVAACGLALNLPGYIDLPLPAQVARVQQLWQTPERRLLVFDNCEDEALLDAWRPTSGGACVLATSRRARWDASLGVITRALDVLDQAESRALLCGFRPDLGADDADLDAIAGALGDLPLALHLAGSYLKRYQRAVTPAAYLARLRAPDALLGQLTLDGRSPTGHAQDLARTFALSVEQLRPDVPADGLARQLLARAACLAPGAPIPRALLAATVAGEGDDRLVQLEDALAQLVDLGLLDETADGALRIHRLIAAFARAGVADEPAQAAVEAAVYDAAARRNQAGYPLALNPLLPHLRVVTSAALDRTSARRAELCNELGYLLKAQGDLAGARSSYEQALAIRQDVLGERHPNTATSLNNLGYLLQAQGDLAGARPYYQQALAINQAELGERHPDTARSLNNLGYLLQAQGDLAGARPYLEHALAIRQAVLGERHPDTATSLNNLGALLQDLGDLAGARLYYEQALAILTAVLGPSHPSTNTVRRNIAALSPPARDTP